MLKDIIESMIESYLQEETGLNNTKTGLQTAKHLIKHFGSKSNPDTGKSIISKKYKTHGYSSKPAISHEEHKIILATNHSAVRDHLKKHGWKQEDVLGDKNIYHHPEHGAKHSISIDTTHGNTTGVRIYKEKGNISE